MKILIFSLLLSSSMVFASDNVSKQYETDSFENLIIELFDGKFDKATSVSNFPSESENKALFGGQYLFCSILADHLAKIDDAPKLYDKGMLFLDEYTEDHAVRDANAYDSMRHENAFSSSIPTLHQSWLINDKQVLKGLIFGEIYRIVNTKYLNTFTTSNKNYEEFKKNYSERCSSLN